MKIRTTVVSRLLAHGIRRVRDREGTFRYRSSDGRAVPQRALRRIRDLRIPPGWADVAINPRAGGRVQAVGRDRAGRWQYRYHASHVARQSRLKFERLACFVNALPTLRRHVSRALQRSDLSEERVLCSILRILLTCFLRPGSGVYAQENGSFGLVTLRREHVSVRGNEIRFDFPGKSHQRQVRVFEDAAVARLVRKLVRLPGRHVFKFEVEGRLVKVRRRQLNVYIKDVMGRRFSAKDFRTWAGTLLCAGSLVHLTEDQEMPGCRLAREKTLIRDAVRETASKLGNTPAVCKASYIAPSLIASYRKASDVGRWLPAARTASRGVRSLERFERALVSVLRNGGSIRC